jgi:hypothetical protein
MVSAVHRSAFATAVAAGLLTGALTVVSTPAAVGMVVLSLAACVIVRAGAVGVSAITVGLLPWLVVFGDLLPHLTKTIAAATAAVTFAIVAKPKGDKTPYSILLRLGIVLLLVPVAISLARQGTGAQFIQAAKYLIFPTMVLAVTSSAASEQLGSIRRAVLWSGGLAVSLEVFLGLAGFGNIGTTYHAGDITGFGNPHDVGLLASCLAAGAVASRLSTTWRFALLGVTTIGTVLTGVRSALLGLALLAVGMMIAARVKVRAVALVALCVAAVFAIGADQVVVHRFERSQSRGEFLQFSTYGSGRGAIYRSALHHYITAPPGELIFGTGLRTIRQFEEEDLGGAFVGHSDVIEVLVQLGAFGFLGLLLIWFVLFRRVGTMMPLLPLVAFSLTNGSLEYLAPVVVALVLTVGPHEKEVDEPVPTDVKELLQPSSATPSLVPYLRPT